MRQLQLVRVEVVSTVSCMHAHMHARTVLIVGCASCVLVSCSASAHAASLQFWCELQRGVAAPTPIPPTDWPVELALAPWPLQASLTWPTPAGPDTAILMANTITRPLLLLLLLLLHWHAARAVQRVPDQWMAHGCHVDADLMGPPRQDLHLAAAKAIWEG